MTRQLYLPPWRIDVVEREGVRRLLPLSQLARVMARALDAASSIRPASIGLVLTGDEELADLNEAHMGASGATDVLSFPFFPPSAFRGEARQPFRLPPRTRPHLGDVVVSVERAVAQAKVGSGGQTGDVAWAPADELRLLVTHGTLHVCGWDHADPAEEAGMRALERKLLG